MKTPMTDARLTIGEYGQDVVNIEFARRLERDLRTLLLGTLALYEDCPLNFAVETCAVFEKWKPEIYKMLDGE